MTYWGKVGLSLRRLRHTLNLLYNFCEKTSLLDCMQIRQNLLTRYSESDERTEDWNLSEYSQIFAP